MGLLDTVRETLRQTELQFTGETLVIGVSGGVDSLVLLHVLYTLASEFGYQLHVATYDHGLRGEESAADAAYVVEVAEALGLGVTVGGGETLPQETNLEMAARQARYTFLAQTALDLDAPFIAVGHHRDDQIETVLMHVLRGSGLTGLRGMQISGRLSESHLRPDIDSELLDEAEYMRLLRPLLNASREDIAAYAAELGLTPRHDPTNADSRFLRNRLRHEVLPLLEEINPNLREALTRLACIAQGDYEIVQDAILAAVLRIVEWDETEDGEIAYVDRAAFLQQSMGLQRGLLRHLLFDLRPGLRDLPYEQIEEACAFIATGGAGKHLNLPAEISLTLGYDEFMLHYGGQIPYPRYIPFLEAGRSIPLAVAAEHEIRPGMRFYSYWVVDGRSQELVRDDPLEATLVIPPNAELTLRTRRPGDRFQPLGLAGRSQKVSDAFTNLKVPRSLRDRVPLLLVDDEIAWFVVPTAGGLQGRVSERFAVRSDERDSVLRLRWAFEPTPS